jgi:hypothetical protein
MAFLEKCGAATTTTLKPRKMLDFYFLFFSLAVDRFVESVLFYFLNPPTWSFFFFHRIGG